MRDCVGQQLVLGWGQSMLLAVLHGWAHDDVCILSFTYSGLEFGTGRLGCAAGGDTLGITRLVGKGRSREAQSLISRLSNSFVLFTVTSARGFRGWCDLGIKRASVRNRGSKRALISWQSELVIQNPSAQPLPETRRYKGTDTKKQDKKPAYAFSPSSSSSHSPSFCPAR
jgi:hypothetical protein